jgi:mercuric ion binding protein
MKAVLSALAVSAALLVSAAAFAAEKTVTLDVKGMYCPACPYIVRKSLMAVPGVMRAKVSFENKTAVVTFDDAKTAVPALAKATTDAGYPSRLKK